MTTSTHPVLISFLLIHYSLTVCRLFSPFSSTPSFCTSYAPALSLLIIFSTWLLAWLSFCLFWLGLLNLLLPRSPPPAFALLNDCFTFLSSRPRAPANQGSYTVVVAVRSSPPRSPIRLYIVTLVPPLEIASNSLHYFSFATASRPARARIPFHIVFFASHLLLHLSFFHLS